MSQHHDRYRPRPHPAPPRFDPESAFDGEESREIVVDIELMRRLLGSIGLTLNPEARVAGLVLVALTTYPDTPPDQVYPEQCIVSFLADPAMREAMAMVAIKALAQRIP